MDVHSHTANMTSEHTQRQLRCLCLVQPECAWTCCPVPRASRHQGSGLATAPPRGSGEILEAPPAPAPAARSPTDSESGLSFALRSDFQPDALPRAGPSYFLTLSRFDTGADLGDPELSGHRPPPPDTPTPAHRARDVVEDLAGGGVPVRTGLGAKQASQLPRAVLSGDKRMGLTSWPPRRAESDPVTQRGGLASPPHLFPFSEGFLEKEARSLRGA